MSRFTLVETSGNLVWMWKHVNACSQRLQYLQPCSLVTCEPMGEQRAQSRAHAVTACHAAAVDADVSVNGEASFYARYVGSVYAADVVLPTWFQRATRGGDGIFRLGGSN